ncbi:hypothetical protein YPPY08_0195, partial [Yersinia pestis PY-08]
MPWSPTASTASALAWPI